eukprot:TRINITY_DN100_c0_g1_i2.p2 TRINITY_DN100_c0_g1~~TRINITY_DN100_c0_g1_i2.p2  ORF type:complete len:917 (+),score=368.15 TRINITY_DN100_c0_g1_i2:80-2830(+)
MAAMLRRAGALRRPAAAVVVGGVRATGSSLRAAPALRLAPSVRWASKGGLEHDEKLRVFRQTVEERARAVKQELAALAAAFMRYDGDGKGLLSYEDIRAALEDLELPTGEVDVAELFKKLDVNKDGTIELTEWLDNLPRGTRVRIVERFSGEGDEAMVNIMDQFLPDAHRQVRLSMPSAKIIYTYTDEAPALATFSFLPVVQAFSKPCGVVVDSADISLAARILANFPDKLRDDQKVPDALDELGKLAKTPSANIIKLPNVSASVPQLIACIKELQEQGYNVPDYPAEPATPEEEAVKERYAKVLGSAVNPVLREGNSDRRVAPPVKEYAKKNPHSMGAWSSSSRTHVAHMEEGDFYGSEQSAIMDRPCSVRIEHVAEDGTVTVLKPQTKLLQGEVVDAAVMSCRKLREFYAAEFAKAKEEGILVSIHLKATMMKISDPIMFGHAVRVYFRDVWEKHEAALVEAGINPNFGLGDLYQKMDKLPADVQADVKQGLEATLKGGPELAMVDSDRGITNLHVPSDIIIDASMPAAIRESGKMWAPDGTLKDTKMIIPDRCYARIYQEVISFCRENGAFDPATMGNVSNVGLMAQKAEEYGSHNKTFEIAADGVVRVVYRDDGSTLFEHNVEKGDIWRMCQTKDDPVLDWVKLAISRARATGAPAVFWLTPERAHDRSLITKVQEYIARHDCSGLDIQIKTPEEAMRLSLQRAKRGEDTISVTGNVLRDYLTDLFPILELGTSAKMLSIVPLLAGGGLFETGAGGSAPKHVQQFLKEGHLRWDSLGEFLALAVSFEDLAQKTHNQKAKVLADALNTATGRLLDLKRSPLRKVHQPDNRASHFYLTLYWAQALAEQKEDPELAARFAPIAAQLQRQRTVIVEEFKAAQGTPVDIGGYYHPDHTKAEAAMRPSTVFNNIIASV